MPLFLLNVLKFNFSVNFKFFPILLYQSNSQYFLNLIHHSKTRYQFFLISISNLISYKFFLSLL